MNDIPNNYLTNFSELPTRIVEQGIIAGQTFAMATSPSKCRMLRVDDEGQLTKRGGARVALEEFYEVVVFCKDWQLTATRSGKGAEIDFLRHEDEQDTICQQYLVWGKVISDPKDGWCKIADPRIGTICFPAPAGVKASNGKKDGDRLILTAREHITQGPHNNSIITRQRLTGIGVYVDRPKEQNAQRGED